MPIAREWFRDIPQQFLSKRNIEVFIKAFSRQMEEIERVLDDVNRLTTIDTATGVNLDYVGNILSITRKEAQVILRKLEQDQLCDDLYRAVLRYQALRNTCECTYEDIISAIKLLWDTDDISYVEPPDRPATIYIKMPMFDIDVEDPAAARILALKSAGVNLLYEVIYYLLVDESNIERMYLKNLNLHWKIPFWNHVLFFDGSWLLDGKYLLNAIRMNMKTGINLHWKVSSGVESIGDASIIIKKMWYFDGSVKADGSKSFDAECRKEMV